MKPTIELQPGEHMRAACERAVALASATKQTVEFRFNDTPVVANPTDTAGDVVARWETTRGRLQAEWRASDEGKRYAADDERRRVAAQDKTDSIIAELPAAAADMDKLIPLLAGLSAAVRADTKWSPADVASLLTAAGYRANEYVGHKPRSDFETNATILGRWIVGQAVNVLAMGMPPHPVTEMFAKQYLQLRAED